MEEQFLQIDPNNEEEQLYYPSLDFLSNPEISSPQEDLFFVDHTFKNEKEDGGNKIIRTDINTFKYKNSYSTIPIIVILVFGIVAPLIPSILSNFSMISIGIEIAFFVISLLLSILIDCLDYRNVNLILEPNSIVLKKKSILRRKTIIYNFGELERFALYYKYFRREETNFHTYTLYFVKKNGKKEKFKDIIQRSMDNDFKGLKYFIDLINAHINKNMK